MAWLLYLSWSIKPASRTCAGFLEPLSQGMRAETTKGLTHWSVLHFLVVDMHEGLQHVEHCILDPSFSVEGFDQGLMHHICMQSLKFVRISSAL